MKFLVLGAGGMAGHTIAIYLKESGHEVVGFARRKLGFVDTVVGDATDRKQLSEVISEGNFDIVINAIGILNQKAEENKDLAVYLNSYLPHMLCAIAKNLPTRVFQMSTDCVFSGNKGRYTENSIPDGLTFYDRTKALGELNDDKNLTLRNSIVGPDINSQGIGLFNWFMSQEGPIAGFERVMWTGLTTLQLAKIMEAAAKEGASGLYNMVPNENISKHELLRLFNKYFKNSALDIVPKAEPIADKTLIRTRFGFFDEVPGYEQMVKEMRDWALAHSDLYPHYKIYA